VTAAPGGGVRPQVGVVVLTQGRNLRRLHHAFDTVLAQRGVEVDVVCVANGWQAQGLPDGVRTVQLSTNRGIPGGRNAGVDAVRGDLLFFLDDDAALPSADVLAEMHRRFAEHPRLGMLQPRVVDPRGRPAPRRWVPRIRKSEPWRSGPVFSIWEGATAVRRDVFERAGRWPQDFFYAHEGIELAWRVWDQGAVVWYAGDLVVEHPAREQAKRHPYHYRLNARNRVWLARRNLPLPLRPVYVASWTLVQLVRSARQPEVLRAWFGGWLEGWRSAPPGRAPMSWRTIARMTRWGRLPVV
jgi:GT2 family glycosyltransferase